MLAPRTSMFIGINAAPMVLNMVVRNPREGSVPSEEKNSALSGETSPTTIPAMVNSKGGVFQMRFRAKETPAQSEDRALCTSTHVGEWCSEHCDRDERPVRKEEGRRCDGDCAVVVAGAVAAVEPEGRDVEGVMEVEKTLAAFGESGNDAAAA